MVASKKGRHTATVHLKKKKKKSKDVGDEVEYRGEWRMDWSLEKGEGRKNITLDQTVQQNPH